MSTSRRTTSRRTVLAAGAGAAAPAGCAKYGGGDGAGAPPGPAESGGAGSGDGGGPRGEALARTSDIPVGGGTINCPCHNSRFRAEDGSVAGGPAPGPLAARRIEVESDSIRLL
ncbi:Rieske (2Fe-2S) protein [Streptomyces sp. GC420]|uniref:Rieske (2Fe-2S) protein n=1 Tax=Streptomyces sp. GC420 TaxID=2697568 RepID=UPI00141508E2|nr:Rieske (2Fe-2S) protein [Streptomyces sp. GC420]NBM18665.1 Rieske 2Fe-2S domain-containing protein [Streptomyces sp. GC420]